MKRVNLRDLCRNIQYGFTASATAVGSGPRFLRITDIRESILDWETTPYVDISENDESKYALQDGDLVIARTGAFTGWNTIITSPPRAVFASYLIRIQVKKDVNPFFIHYFLQSPAYSEHIESILGGSAQPNASAVALTDVELDLPSLNVQNQIADILRSFDNKIEANAACCRTLEEMSQTLFKSWFVDFDPVVAKSEGRKPFGMSDEIAALFPDSFEESELGAVPRGWRVSVLGEMVDVIDCLHSKKPVRNPSGTGILLQLENIRDDGLLDLSDRYLISQADYDLWTKRVEIGEGDCVITNVGRVGAVSRVPKGVKAAIGRNITALRPRRYPSFVSTLLLSKYMKTEIEFWTDTGTILDALNVKSIPKLRFLHPGEEILRAFDDILAKLWCKREAALAESQLLEKCRDCLLPRLLSGELDGDDVPVVCAEGTAA